MSEVAGRLGGCSRLSVPAAGAGGRGWPGSLGVANGPGGERGGGQGQGGTFSAKLALGASGEDEVAVLQHKPLRIHQPRALELLGCVQDKVANGLRKGNLAC